MDPEKAGRELERALGAGAIAPMTIADAAARSGLPLRDAERGMHWLTSTYRGHLRVTSEGELLFFFPDGFTRPWQDGDRARKAARAVGRGLRAAARFTVRAWLTIVMVVYVAAFVAVLIAILFAGSNGSSSRSSSSSSSRRGGGALIEGLFRIVFDALYWTFHPFSPVGIGSYSSYDDDAYAQPRRGRRAAEGDGVPFYEKVDRFVFGPEEPREDPRVLERRVLAEIRAQKGRIGLADVMRVTGLPRAEADPLMARLMLDYHGDVHVSDGGGITYSFEALRKTTEQSPREHGAFARHDPRPSAAWDRERPLPPLTGNASGSNAAIAALNGFNLVMGLVSLSLGLTVANVVRLFQGFTLDKLPWDGAPVALGIVPILFSALVLAAPLARAAARPLRRRRATKESGRLALLREVLTRSGRGRAVSEQVLSDAYQRATGSKPSPGELTRVVVELGGDVEPDGGQVRYRFADLEAEAEALDAERRAASESEAKVGEVVFASDR